LITNPDLTRLARRLFTDVLVWQPDRSRRPLPDLPIKLLPENTFVFQADLRANAETPDLAGQ
jgi:hypothetical protein